MATTKALHSCILLILITCLSTSPLSVISQSQTQRCHPDDIKALLQIKRQFHSPSLRRAWNPRSDCCSWTHVSCDLRNNRVNFLFFDGALTLHRPTPIPPAISDLPFLHELQLKNAPNLTGPIPPSFANLKNLQILTISHTSLSAQIPQFLTQLSKLTTLDLSYNHLTGPIPPSLTRLKFLNQLSLDGNNLNGPIPETFGSFSKNFFDSLTLSRNRLNGPIPPSLSKLDISVLDLSWNKLEGDASVLFGTNKKYIDLRISGNSFAFDLGKIGVPNGLTKLKIDHNHIYGKLPGALTELKDLEEINVSYNELCGEIPQGGNLHKFNASSYAPNKCLCGSPLPKCK